MSYLKDFLPYLFGNKVGKLPTLPDIFYFDDLSFEEKLMFKTFLKELDHFVAGLDWQTLSQKDRYHLCNFYQFLNAKHKGMLDQELSIERSFFKDALHFDLLGKKGLRELLEFKVPEVKVVVILRKERKLPGLLLIQKPNGELLLNNWRRPFSLPVLCYSSRGLSFHHSNGWTPSGVYSINGVMPEADKFSEYGLYRRLIVDFVPASLEEELLRSKIPFSHFDRHWWKQGVLARDLGRSLLRIHGTGEVNRKLTSSFYPFVPTSGCIATREWSFFGRKFHDQRRLLDALMRAQGEELSFENEAKIKALLYVVELDDKKTAVKMRDIKI